MIFERYTVILVILYVSATIVAEPPANFNSGNNRVVSQRLLNRVADIIANGGDGSARGGDDGTQNNEGPSIVDQQLLDRIARIISQNDGQLSWSQKGHARSIDSAGGQPSASLSLPQNSNEHEYGVPPAEVPEKAKELVGTQFELSPPEPVPRIASFDFNDDDDIGFSASSPQQIVQDSYADNGNRYQGRGGGRIELGEPQNAERIASFDIEGETPPAPFTPPQGRGGYFTNTK